MQSIEEKIKKLKISAFKNKDTDALNILNLLIADIQRVKIAQGKKDLTDQAIIKIVRKYIKRTLDATEQYKKLGKSEQASIELNQAELLKKLVPELITGEKLEEIIDKLIAQMDSPNIGQVIAELSKKYPGSIDDAEASILIIAKLKNKK